MQILYEMPCINFVFPVYKLLLYAKNYILVGNNNFTLLLYFLPVFGFNQSGCPVNNLAAALV